MTAFGVLRSGLNNPAGFDFVDANRLRMALILVFEKNRPRFAIQQPTARHAFHAAPHQPHQAFAPQQNFQPKLEAVLALDVHSYFPLPPRRCCNVIQALWDQLSLQNLTARRAVLLMKSSTQTISQDFRHKMKISLVKSHTVCVKYIVQLKLSTCACERDEGGSERDASIGDRRLSGTH